MRIRLRRILPVQWGQNMAAGMVNFRTVASTQAVVLTLTGGSAVPFPNVVYFALHRTARRSSAAFGCLKRLKISTSPCHALFPQNNSITGTVVKCAPQPSVARIAFFSFAMYFLSGNTDIKCRIAPSLPPASIP